MQLYLSGYYGHFKEQHDLLHLNRCLQPVFPPVVDNKGINATEYLKNCTLKDEEQLSLVIAPKEAEKFYLNYYNSNEKTAIDLTHRKVLAEVVYNILTYNEPDTTHSNEMGKIDEKTDKNRNLWALLGRLNQMGRSW
jgi:hypothetical protein